MAPLPSKGGRGMRLKAKRMRLSEKKMLTNEAAPANIPPPAAEVTWEKVMDWGG